MQFTVQGTVLSKVLCHKERQIQAERRGLSINEVPLKYGSVRIGVNVIKLDGTVYKINKMTDALNIKEERLILEISYKFDEEGNVIEYHDIVNDLEQYTDVELSMGDAYISKNHYLKLINVGSSSTIKSYFIKSWANKIYFLNSLELKTSDEWIKPKQVVKTMCLDPQLIIN